MLWPASARREPAPTLSALRGDFRHIYFAIFPGNVFFCPFFRFWPGK